MLVESKLVYEGFKGEMRLIASVYLSRLNNLSYELLALEFTDFPFGGRV